MATGGKAKRKGPVFERATRSRRGCGERVLGFRAVQVREFIVATITSEGIAPTYGRIADELGFVDKTAVRNVIRRLEKRGLLVRVGFYRVSGQSRRQVMKLELC